MVCICMVWISMLHATAVERRSEPIGQASDARSSQDSPELTPREFPWRRVRAVSTTWRARCVARPPVRAPSQRCAGMWTCAASQCFVPPILTGSLSRAHVAAKHMTAVTHCIQRQGAVCGEHAIGQASPHRAARPSAEERA
mmetsp:Transcript_21538/g.43641  ORF Transcript_21538/g.43641 Transcript_21538/m.43641 type:complete len:141 (-) Transcript_21538:903-1325(-)